MPHRLRNMTQTPDADLEGSSDDQMGYVVAGSMFCRLVFWTEEEWAEIEESERPQFCVHAPGVGWIGAVPIHSLN